jgi:hypothetical protein
MTRFEAAVGCEKVLREGESAGRRSGDMKLIFARHRRRDMEGFDPGRVATRYSYVIVIRERKVSEITRFGDSKDITIQRTAIGMQIAAVVLCGSAARRRVAPGP